MCRLSRLLMCAAIVLVSIQVRAQVPRVPPAKAAAWVIPNAQLVVYADVSSSLKMIDEVFKLALELPVLRTIPEVQGEVEALRANLQSELDAAVRSSGVDFRNKVTLAMMSFSMDNAGMMSAFLVVRGDFSAGGGVESLLSGVQEEYKGRKVARLPDSQLVGGGMVYADKQFLVLGNAQHVRDFIDKKAFGKSPISARLGAMPASTLIGTVADMTGLLGVQMLRSGVEAEVGRPVLDMMLGLESVSLWLEPKGMALNVVSTDAVAAEWARDTLTAAADYLAAFPLLIRGTGLALLANAGLLEENLPPDLLHLMADRKEFAALVDWVYKATKFSTTVKTDPKKMTSTLSAKGDVPALLLVLSVAGATLWYLNTAQEQSAEEELLRQLQELERMQEEQDGNGQGAPPDGFAPPDEGPGEPPAEGPGAPLEQCPAAPPDGGDATPQAPPTPPQD